MEDTVKVVDDGEVLHLINDGTAKETECGVSYDNDEVIERPIGNAGVWCLDCMNLKFD